MILRLGLIAAFLIVSFTLWATHYCVAAGWTFLIFSLLILEAVMLNCLTYSSFNIRIGKAKESKKLEGSPDTLNRDILCIPVFLRVRFWEAKNLRIILRSGDIQVDSEVYDGLAYSVSFLQGTFSLEWFSNKYFACIGCFDGNTLTLGSPPTEKYLLGKSSVPVKLEVWKDIKLISFACFTLSIVDGTSYLSDREYKVDEYVEAKKD